MTEATQIPDEVSYTNTFKPKGYFTTFKEWPITPMSSNQYWLPDEILRFLVTIKNGVMDPYRSHIEILVSIPEGTCPVGGLQIDSSAQGFIAQTVLSSNNVEVERITEYDTLACYLTDIGFSEYVCESRTTEGLGYSNQQSNQPWSTVSGTASQVLYCNTDSMQANQWILENNFSGLKLPTTMPFNTGRGNSSAFEVSSYSEVDYSQVVSATSSAVSGTNPLWGPPSSGVQLSQIQQLMGRFGNVRAEYANSLLSNNYPDGTTTHIQTSPQIQNQQWTVATMMQNNTSSGYNPKSPYSMKIPQNTYFNQWIGPGNVFKTMYVPNTPNLFGFQKPICGEFSRGCNEAIISPTIPQCQMQNGVLLTNKVPVSTQLFRIPLISAICGILIPPEQFLLIPMEALYNLLVEVTLSKFAMFTTGYNDVHEFDQTGMQSMQQRKWVISEIYWNLHLYSFADPAVNYQIESSLVKTIPISATMYILASQYQLPNGQVVRNSWPVGTQSESLCEIICLFLANDYNQYSFCRKQFRLSNNISSMQIKIGTEFSPSQPIIGNAGNPCTLDTTGDAWPFYEQILLSSNFLFNTNIPSPKINIKNFCINNRPYNIKNTSTFYDPTMFQNSNYVWTENSVNADTAMGMSNFHENRYIGKAAFIYTWEPYGHSKNYMTGINTQGIQNFNVIFNTTNLNYFPRDQTLLMFTRSNVIVLYSKEGVRVLGK